MKAKPRPSLVDAKNSDDRRDRTSRQVSFDYIKGNQFRTIHPDGAIGGASSPDRIQIAFFCERQAIPQRVTNELNVDGTLGPVIETVGRDAVVREIDLAVSLTRKTAQGLISFLTKALSEDPAAEEPKQPVSAKTPRRKKTV